MAKRKCSATKKNGDPCGAAPLEGADTCLSHSDQETRDRLGFGGPQEGSGRPRRPRLAELYQEVAEEQKEKIREVLIGGLEAERAVVVGNGPSAHVQNVPDIPTRLKTVAEITDRTDGKPRQAIEHTGSDGGPLEVVDVERDRAPDVADLLSRIGAISPSMNGGGNGNGSGVEH